MPSPTPPQSAPEDVAHAKTLVSLQEVSTKAKHKQCNHCFYIQKKESSSFLNPCRHSDDDNDNNNNNNNNKDNGDNDKEDIDNDGDNNYVDNNSDDSDGRNNMANPWFSQSKAPPEHLTGCHPSWSTFLRYCNV